MLVLIYFNNFIFIKKIFINLNILLIIIFYYKNSTTVYSRKQQKRKLDDYEYLNSAGMEKQRKRRNDYDYLHLATGTVGNLITESKYLN